MIKKINVLSDQIASGAAMLLIRLRNCSSALVFAILIYYAAGGCSSSPTPRENLAQLISDSLRSELNKIIQTSIIPGFAVSIVKQDSVLFAEGFGYADQQAKKPFTTETVNCIASISKTFIGLSVMQLVESGKLNLDDPINTILPYKIINPYFPNIPITIRHLVTHTSTLNQEFDPEEAGGSVILLLENIEMDSSTPEDFSKSINYYKKGRPISVDEHIRNYTILEVHGTQRKILATVLPAKNLTILI